MSRNEAAPLILLNGKVWTGNEKEPWAAAIAIHGDRISAVGSSEQIRGWIRDGSQVIDLNGRLVLPGFNDAHTHFIEGGLSLRGVDLRGAENEEEFRQRIARRAEESPDAVWITGGNWDHERWPSKKYPRRELIDDVTPGHPALVNRMDMHMSLANSLALQLAGIDRRTPDPPGGEIVRDERTGAPTGILKDAAQDIVKKLIPAPDEDELLRAAKTALQHAAEVGVTSIQDNSAVAHFRLYQRLLASEELTARIYSWSPADGLDSFRALGVTAPFGNEMLRVGCVKLYTDGSMGAGTAWLFEPYSDNPAHRGLAIYDTGELARLIADADAAGLQLAVHAIGDRATYEVLNLFERALKRNGAGPRRHRVEHAQVVRDEDMPRFAAMGILVSLQPSHCIDDMRWLTKRLGDRIVNAHRLKSFITAGAGVAFGTDWTVEPLNPMLGIYAAVAREFPEGGPPGGWFPDERLTMEEAIGGYTLGSAYAEFTERDKGSIEKGKLADLVVLSADLFSIPPSELLTTKVERTVVGGRTVFERRSGGGLNNG